MITENISTDILQRGLPNQPGLAGLYAVPLEGIVLPQLFDIFNPANPDFEQDTSLSSVTFASGYNWLRVANDFPLPASIIETEKESPQGVLYTYVIKQDIPLDDYLTRGQIIRAWSRHEWVLCSQAVDGTWRLFGGINGHGAKFKGVYSSGTQSKGPTKYTLDFTWECSERAPYLIAP